MSNYLTDQKPRQLADGLTGHYIHGNSMTMGIVKIKAGSQLARHQHPHEQITYILEGELDMVIGETAYNLRAGMSLVIPSNVFHNAVAHTDCQVLDVFAPVREDYV